MTPPEKQAVDGVDTRREEPGQQKIIDYGHA
jgi:hypothetical protein